MRPSFFFLYFVLCFFCLYQIFIDWFNKKFIRTSHVTFRWILSNGANAFASSVNLGGCRVCSCRVGRRYQQQEQEQEQPHHYFFSSCLFLVSKIIGPTCSSCTATNINTCKDGPLCHWWRTSSQCNKCSTGTCLYVHCI